MPSGDVLANVEVDICNRAIDLAGGQRVNSLEENSEEARLCSSHLKFLRWKLLYDNDWKFASRISESIAEKTPVPDVDEWDHKYLINMPDFIRFREIMDTDNTYTIGYMADGAEQGQRVLYTNENPPITIRYTANATLGVWSVGFVESITYFLAAELSRSLVDTSQQSLELRGIAEQKKAEAILEDANESQDEVSVELLVNLR